MSMVHGRYCYKSDDPDPSKSFLNLHKCVSLVQKTFDQQICSFNYTLFFEDTRIVSSMSASNMCVQHQDVLSR